MSQTRSLWGCLFMSLFIANSLWAATYYVDPNGYDGDPNTYGTINDPFATIKYAIDQTTDEVADIIHIKEGEYQTIKIELKSNLTLDFEQGTVVSAEPNGIGLYDSLFVAENKENIQIAGNHSTFQMNKEEYLSGEWRMVLSLLSCKKVTISGLTLRDSGGDGIYVGMSREAGASSYCENISISDVICDNNHRNGIGIISVDGLIIENCLVKNTNGTKPEAGIDFEPNLSSQVLKDIYVSRVSFENNNRIGISVDCNNLTETSQDIDIQIDQVLINDSEMGLYIKGLDDGPDGTVKCKNVYISNVETGAYLHKSSNAFDLIFEDCIWTDFSKSEPPIEFWANSLVRYAGGVKFDDCVVLSDSKKPVVRCWYISGEELANVSGDIYAINSRCMDDLYNWEDIPTSNITLNCHRAVPFINKVFNKNQSRWDSSLQTAIDSAEEQDELIVCPGIYKSIDLGGTDILIKGLDPNNWTVVKKTIINAEDSTPAVNCNGQESSECKLEGLTITGGSQGGINGNGAELNVIKCSITDNFNAGHGAGICNVDGIISNCIIASNSGYSGGLSGCDGVIENCIISDNTGTNVGGLENCDGHIINCTIVNNSANSGYIGGVDNCNGSGKFLSNCIIWGNSPNQINSTSCNTPRYSCIQGWQGGGTNNINVAPSLSGADNDFYYHLKSNSPCIDQGDDSAIQTAYGDIDNSGRILGESVDMGADEHYGIASWWKLDEKTDSIANDLVGSNQGTLYGFPSDDSQWSDGIKGGALTFDGIDDYVDLGSNSTLDITSEITLTAWIYPVSYPSSYVGAGIISKSYWSTSVYSLKLSSEISQYGEGNLVFQAYNGSSYYTVTSNEITIPLDQWTFVAAVYDGSKLKFYVNDETKEHDITQSLVSMPSNTVYLGRVGSSGSVPGWFAGSIDDARIYNRALDESEIISLALSAYCYEEKAYNLDQQSWHSTIQDAIDDANDFDEIAVYPGTYYEAIDFNSKSITVRSVDPTDWDIVEATVIDANGLSSYHVVTFADSEDANSILSGFTITGGNADSTGYDDSGAGIFCNGTSPTIQNCLITENDADDYGGGMYLVNSSAEISDCNFLSNTAGIYGGAIRIYAGDPVITNCDFASNSSEDNGGAIQINNSESVIADCDFVSNSSGDYGGAVQISDGDPVITNCEFSDNSSVQGGGISNNGSAETVISWCIFAENKATLYGAGVYTKDSPLVAISNCIFHENSADGSGGGVQNTSSSIDLLNCVFWANEAKWGGAMHNYTSSPDIINCTFTLNEAIDNNGGGKGGAMRNTSNSDPVITNCIFWADSGENGDDEISNDDINVDVPDISFSNVDSYDPNFVDDYYLSISSACIGAGDPNGDYTGQTDIEGDDRVIDNRVDMGADESDYGLVHYQAMDESSGTTSPDTSGYDNDGTLINGPVWMPSGGIIDGCLEFDGINDLVQTPFILNPEDGSFSAFAWIQTSVASGTIMTQLDGTGTGRVWLNMYNGKFCPMLQDTSGSGVLFADGLDDPSLDDGQWHHVGVVWDYDSAANEGIRYLYIDGVMVKCDEDDSPIGNLEPSDGDMRIGLNKYGNHYWDGLIDDVRIYDCALGQDAIAELYGMGQ